MSLTSSQRVALQQLLAVTASTTDAARERDERILRDVGWDVQRAVETLFATDSGPPPVSSSSPPLDSRHSMEQFEIDDSLSGIRPPPGSRRLSGSQRRPMTSQAGLSLWETITWPVNFMLSILTGGLYLFIRTFVPLSFLPHLPRFLHPPNPPSSATHRPSNQTPTSSSRTYIQDLEQLTGCSSSSNTLPEIYIGSYRDFLGVVRKEGKVGLVIVTSGEHENDEEFKKGVMCDGEFVRILREKEVLVWAGDTRSREGYQVAQTLLVTTYPSLTFVSLLPTSTSPTSSTPRLSIITTLSGPPSTITSSSSIIQSLTNTVLPRVTPFLSRLKRERLALEESRHLREEQDRAFRNAEKKDREKMDEKKKAEEVERVKKERAEREEREKVERIEKRRVWRRYARKHLLPPSEGSIRVSLRTPFSSERKIRQFMPGTSTVGLFVYAETLLIPEGEMREDDPDEAPEGYEPEWDFRVVTSYPRIEIERVEEGGEAVWEAVKKAGGALFAEKVENGVWGDAERAGDDSDEEEVDAE